MTVEPGNEDGGDRWQSRGSGIVHGIGTGVAGKSVPNRPLVGQHVIGQEIVGETGVPVPELVVARDERAVVTTEDREMVRTERDRGIGCGDRGAGQIGQSRPSSARWCGPIEPPGVGEIGSSRSTVRTRLE